MAEFFSIFGCLSCLQLAFDIFLAGSSDTLRRQQMYICTTQEKKIATLPFADMSPNMAKFRSFLRIFGEKRTMFGKKGGGEKCTLVKKSLPLAKKGGGGKKAVVPPSLNHEKKAGRQGTAGG